MKREKSAKQDGKVIQMILDGSWIIMLTDKGELWTGYTSSDENQNFSLNKLQRIKLW